MSKHVYTSRGGLIKNNYVLVGSGNTTKTVTVPSGKRWLLYVCFMDADVQCNCTSELFDENDKNMGKIGYEANANIPLFHPDSGAGGEMHPGNMPVPMYAGWYVKFTFASAQGAAAYVGCIVEEADD